MARIPRLCTIDGCGKKHSSRGWCSTHYNNWRMRGDPNSVGSRGQPRKHVYPENATEQEMGRIRARINRAKAIERETPEQYEARLAAQRKYDAEHVEERRAYDRARRAEKSDELRAKGRAYYAANSEKWDEYRRRRKALKRQGEPYTTEQVIKLYGTDCHICGEPVDMGAPRQAGTPGWERGLHLDHLVTLYEGGPDVIENIRPSHGLCNLRKGRRSTV